MLALSQLADASTWYVCTNGNDGAAGTNWATAMQTIQAAVDTAVSNDTVMVSNGVYATGGRVVYGTMTNRIAVSRRIAVRSANGPAVTTIRGAWNLLTTNGDNAVRCAYLTNGALLAGFTLTNGATRLAGDTMKERSGGGVWCESGGLVSNCMFAGNSASAYGGGVYAGTLSDCAFSGNSALYGGGAAGGTANNCAFSGNSAASGNGGGAAIETLNNCTLAGNWANMGGGMDGGTANNCTFSGNSGSYGGGTVGSVLNNCTLSGNSARFWGGGAYGGTLNNCIAYDNTAASDANYYSGTLSFCCSTPMPPGTGNITNTPRFVATNDLRLAAGSPCIDAGSNVYASGATDLDGLPRIIGGVVDMGAYEGARGVVTFDASGGSVSPTSKWVTAGVPYGPLPVPTRPPLVFGGWWPLPAATGTQVTASTVVTTVGNHTVYASWMWLETYVCTTGSDTLPGTNWAKAKATIQAGIDAVAEGGTVWVSNGVYAAGGRAVYGTITNRIAITKPITVRSVNGPATTLIRGTWHPGTTNGDSAVRCAYLTSGALLAGFTLTNGATRLSGDTKWERSGGGACCEPDGVLSNCTLVRNSASQYGGGVYGGTLLTCTLARNSASQAGGGSYDSVLTACTLSGNSSSNGGGSSYGALNDCTLAGNSASQYGGGSYDTTLSNCTLSGNSAAQLGGGSFYGTLNNCSLSNNSASSRGGGSFGGGLNHCRIVGNTAGERGGGVCLAVLTNCTLTGNSADWWGGGAYYSDLRNCTLSSNSARFRGGGAELGTLSNCIVYYNTAPTSTNWSNATLTYCCTTPMPSGTGNITNAPMFVANDNLHLAPESPCINRGLNVSVATATDLDGLPRIAGGVVDIGAYEFQGDVLTAFPLWVFQHGLPTDGSADQSDPDGDGVSTAAEYVADTDPTNAASRLALLGVETTGTTVRIEWQGGIAVTQYVEFTSALSPTGTSWVTLFTNFPPTTALSNLLVDPPSAGTGMFRLRAVRGD